MLELGTPDEWPKDVRDALKRFRLGHLLAKPPLVYARVREHRIWAPGRVRDDVPFAGIDDPFADVVEVASDRFPYGIITTQTCDINEQSRFLKQPFVQVSPVYRYATGRSALVDVSRKQYVYPLTAAKFVDDVWVADLRMECCVEKSVLAVCKPVDAFATEVDEIAFADRLGRRRDRAAMGNAVSSVLDAHLSKKISNNRAKAKLVFESVYGLRLEVAEGKRLQPIAMRLHVLLSGDPDANDEAIQGAKRWFEEWWDRAVEASESHEPSLRVLPNSYHDASRMAIPLYERTIAYDRGP